MRDILERAFLPRSLAGNLPLLQKDGWTVESEELPGKPVTHVVIDKPQGFGVTSRGRRAVTAADPGGFHLIRRRRAA